MTTLWKVVYKTYPEPGERHDEEDVFFANGLGWPGRHRNHYNFGDGKRRYTEEDVVKVEKLWNIFDGPPPRELVEEHPDAEWLKWVDGSNSFPRKCDDGEHISSVISDA